LNVLNGALAALASYALFHLVTVFPLSWVALYAPQSLAQLLTLELLGALLCAAAMPLSGLIADRIGRRRLLGIAAALIAAFSAFAPWLLDGGTAGQTVYIIVGFGLLGLSYGQCAGAMSDNFLPRLRYTGAALSTDLAWLLGAAFAPLLVLALSVRFGLAAVSVYLSACALCTLWALQLNRRLQSPRD